MLIKNKRTTNTRFSIAKTTPKKNLRKRDDSSKLERAYQRATHAWDHDSFFKKTWKNNRIHSVKG